MINRVVLIGRMTKDVELRYTQSGTAVGSFTLAVNRPFKNNNGEREADFINAVIWRKPAENFANFTGKGAQVAIEGRLQTRNYENNQGQRVYVTEVVVDNFSLLESKAEADKRRAENGTEQPAQQPSNNKFAQPGNSEIDISDDDLPF
ncbi:single-stranded DNA-binding protein [Fructobacillus tropaeoli]|uniref:Single-stranded DNA-binding protein n=1 Tax=Fructobacillus tropaeoli TaxID=709323 RepID=A0ABN9YNY3_9LACO|nr:Single-stranded DNA-binding protein (Ssb) [Fructobacillus tropaeoli]CAK1234532.1 Single-stranded DNA-binding protein (Ssb) [Fructobacillus tropaeoli]